ncbi:thioesterase II family protein [Streptomyces sp. NPDC060194]|uniref:thioesterase II family protein n=1 Tax=Streptomyces sp. NPDC060194 TaxID=3347069 RepID=UPI00364B8163
MGAWISSWPSGAGAVDPPALPVLLCLPPAGAGCQQFRPWQAAFDGVAQVHGVQLPGRENRWREPMPATFGEAVEAVVAELSAVLAGRRVVVFGHSFGGLLGYEVARRVDPSALVALVVSGCRAPSYWDGAGRGIVDDESELDKLFDTAGLDPAFLDEETRALMVAMLRKDAVLSLSYAYGGGKPLGVPVHAWGADADETVSAEELSGWAAVTSARFAMHQVPGGHHAVLRRPEVVQEHLAGLLRGAAALPAG